MFEFQNVHVDTNKCVYCTHIHIQKLTVCLRINPGCVRSEDFKNGTGCCRAWCNALTERLKQGHRGQFYAAFNALCY